MNFMKIALNISEAELENDPALLKTELFIKKGADGQNQNQCNCEIATGFGCQHDNQYHMEPTQDYLREGRWSWIQSLLDFTVILSELFCVLAVRVLDNS